jgi:hypothetical protein
LAQVPNKLTKPTNISNCMCMSDCSVSLASCINLVLFKYGNKFEADYVEIADNFSIRRII